MNITYLIGNGFDVNLGLKTRYCDFYKYYLALPSDSDDVGVSKLKKLIKDDYETWADFEEELGKNLDKFNEEEFFSLIVNVRKHLFDFVKKEENKFILEKNEDVKLKRDFTFLEDYLTAKDKVKFKHFVSGWNSDNWYVNIVNFNYTTVLENYLEFKPDMHLPRPGGNRLCYLHDILHIHGESPLNMVLGVNDISQINNNVFVKNSDILDAIVKADCNDAMGHLVDGKCIDVINNSNLICLFGVSLGNTDKRWWNFIAKSLTKVDCRLIYFSYDNKGLDHNSMLRGIHTRYKNKFLSHMDLDDNSKKILADRIFVVHNSDFFKVKVIEEKTAKLAIDEVEENGVLVDNNIVMMPLDLKTD